MFKKMAQLKVIICSMAVILGFFSPQLLAEGSAYRIELMVFSQTMPSSEVFKQASSQINWPSGLTELSAYQKANTTLDDGYVALSKDPVYQPILHVAWVQSAVEGGLSAPVHILNASGTLNGYFQIQQVPSLQLMADFELTPNPHETVFRLHEKRAIKLNEVYYLDHPKFGVIAKISPF